MTCAFESVADTHVSSRVELLEPILLCERPFVIVSRADGSAGTDSAPTRTIVLKTMDPVSVLVSASVLSRVGELQAAVGVLADAVHSLMPTAALVGDHGEAAVEPHTPRK